MAFVETLYLEIGPFPMTKPLRGKHSLLIWTWAQGATDGGGTIETGIGTTAGNGEVIASFSHGNVKDKPIGDSISATTGIVTLDVDTTGGPTVGYTIMLVKKR